MNMDDYKNTLPYPTKKYKIVVYGEGKVIGEFTEEEYNEYHTQWLKDNKKNRLMHPIKERVWINREEYEKASEEYHDNELFLYDKFAHDLFEEFGVTDNKKAEKCLSYAWQYGHSSGLNEVYNYFSEFVELIK